MTRATAVAAEYQSLSLSSIDASKTNPRTHFDKEKLAELASSIKQHGVLEPVLVRPKGKRYELVAGERRFRAAKIAKLEKIPAIVRKLDDKAALEIQVIENLQRQDLHVLEEAEGYGLLLKKHGYTADMLAEKIGKSRSYVYQRMKLIDLCAPARNALHEGKISHSVALLVARIPDAKLQHDALKRIVGNQYNDPMSYRRASEFVQHEFMVKLAGAPFDREDRALVPAAGSCTTCKFRTGNQSDLFDDVKGADVCTKPTCFAEKVDAHLAIQAKERGCGVLSSIKAKTIFYPHGDLIYDAPYVDAEAKSDYSANAKKFKDYIDDESKIVLVRDPAGRVRKLIPRKDLPAKFNRQRTTSSRPYDAEAANRKWKRQQTIKELEEKAIVESVAGALTKPITLEQLLPAVAVAITIERSHERSLIGKRLGVKAPEGYAKPDKIIAFVETLNAAQQLALVVYSVAMGDSGDDVDASEAMMRALGLDRKAIVRDATAKVKERWAAEDDGKKKGTKKSRAANPKTLVETFDEGEPGVDDEEAIEETDPLADDFEGAAAAAL